MMSFRARKFVLALALAAAAASPALAAPDCFTDRIRAIIPQPAVGYLVQTVRTDQVFLSISASRFESAGWQVGDDVTFCLRSASWRRYNATDQRNNSAVALTLGKDVPAR
jgi:hypothetical protein